MNPEDEDYLRSWKIIVPERTPAERKQLGEKVPAEETERRPDVNMLQVPDIRPALPAQRVLSSDEIPWDLGTK